ncbi:MAG TPA: glycosyltransferase family 2 protein [Alphaproteobacteria bacterium]|jgi:glycosyltransferase involved in cell wall biosynthesis|nr:glycosyltransferase family 2 protein [Alphaproteobacteria bacterium]
MTPPLTWSVVLTTYNRPAMLNRAIQSCLAQTVPCEIVIVDDGSAAESQAVAGRFPQAIYIRNPANVGHSRSVNIGMARASGHWIKHLDDDDFLHPDCLRRTGDVIASAHGRGYDPKIASCVSTNVDIDEKPRSRTASLPADGPMLIARRDVVRIMMLDQAPFGTPAQVAHEREAGLRVGGWNEARPFKFQNGDEAEFWIKLAPQGDMIFIPEPLAYRTLWSGNEAPSPLDRLHISRYLKGRIREQATGEPGAAVPPEILRYLDLHWGLVALKEGNLSTALKLLPRGMLYPKSYTLIRRRRRFADAMQCAIALD